MNQEPENLTGAKPNISAGDAPVKTETAKVAQKVTSSVTIDFPSLDWGIHAGEERELPADPAAQEVILSNQNITPIK